MEKLVFSLSAYRHACGRTLNPPALTPTLMDVLHRYANGGTCRTVAEDRGSAIGTVKHQCQRIRDVLGADTISQAVAMGIRRGIIE